MAAAQQLEEPPRTPADDGLFGPESVTWRLYAQPSVGVGIGTAVLMQMLLPGVVRMINQSSSFKNDTALRARLTLEYMTTTTYGDVASAERAGEMLRNIHRAQKAIDPITKAEYKADEPDLLMWVQNTIVWASLRASELWGPKLTAAERDGFVVEQRIAARLVGIDPASAPGSAAELDDYMDSMRPRLAMTEDARALVLESMLAPKPGGSTWTERLIARAFIDMLPRDMAGLFGLRRGTWSRWTTGLVAGVLLRLAASREPYPKLLPGLRQDAMSGTFSGGHANRP
jgi:uncharacterized protein (DUF2236 family)